VYARPSAAQNLTIKRLAFAKGKPRAFPWGKEERNLETTRARTIKSSTRMASTNPRNRLSEKASNQSKEKGRGKKVEAGPTCHSDDRRKQEEKRLTQSWTASDSDSSSRLNKCGAPPGSHPSNPGHLSTSPCDSNFKKGNRRRSGGGRRSGGARALAI